MLVGASATQVPLFALFELAAYRSLGTPRANNAKDGTSLVTARTAYQGRESGTLVPSHD